MTDKDEAISTEEIMAETQAMVVRLRALLQRSRDTLVESEISPRAPSASPNPAPNPPQADK